MSARAKIKTDFFFPLNLVRDEDIISGGHFSFGDDFESHKSHTHESIVLAGVNSGLLGTRVNGKSSILNSKVMVCIPAQAPHHMTGLGIHCDGWYVNIPGPRLKGLGNSERLFAAEGLLVQLCWEVASWGPTDQDQKTPQQKRLVEVLVDEILKTKAVSDFGVPIPRESNLAEVVREFMKDPITNRSLDYWAKVAGVSRRSFTSSFREQTGITFGEWKHRVLLQEALKHLNQGFSVKETANLLGYSSVSSFTEKFRKDTGLAPKEFLKNRLIA